jgi:hypothetical protein
MWLHQFELDRLLAWGVPDTRSGSGNSPRAS